MINRSIQCFLLDTYGRAAWDGIAAAAGLDADGFEAMLDYDPAETEAVLRAAVLQLAKPREMILEDLGTYMVSHPHMQVIRRLLRFGGSCFLEFLYSLDELPERARLAVPELRLPRLELREHDPVSFAVLVHHPVPGFGHVLVGILRAMADDYGSLVLLDFQGRRDAVETVTVVLAEASFAEGRRFDLRVQAQ